MKVGVLGGRLAAVHVVRAEEAVMELYVGGDLSRKRLDWFAVWPDGAECGRGAASPDRDGLARFAGELNLLGERVCVVVESMTGARFVHDELEVRIADARRAKFAVELLGLARGAKRHGGRGSRPPHASTHG